MSLGCHVLVAIGVAIGGLEASEGVGVLERSLALAVARRTGVSKALLLYCCTDM